MAIANGDAIKVVCKMRYNNAGDMINTFHVTPTVGVPADDADFFDQVGNYVDLSYGTIVGSLPDILTFEDITMYNLTQDSFVGTGPWPNQVSGGGATDAVSPQIASLVVFPTSFLRTQGRKYVPGFTEALYTDGALTAGALAILTTFGARFLDTIALTGFSVRFGVYRPDPLRFAFLQSAKIIPNTRTQRRRTLGFGS
jgi:hypothetical protein